MPNIVKYIIASAIVLVCIGGAFFIGLKMAPMLPGISGIQASADGSLVAAAPAKEEKKKPSSPPKFYSLEKFVISVTDGKIQSYVLLELSLQSSQEGAMDKFKDAEPLVRNSLMKLFSSKPLVVLKDANNVEMLQTEAKELLDIVFEDNSFEVELDNVLFTRMIIQ